MSEKKPIAVSPIAYAYFIIRNNLGLFSVILSLVMLMVATSGSSALSVGVAKIMLISSLILAAISFVLVVKNGS